MYQYRIMFTCLKRGANMYQELIPKTEEIRTELLELMSEKNLSVSAMARRCDINSVTFRAFVAGHRVSGMTLHRIKKFLEETN
jgi:predicted transcriptional regulator